MERILITGGSGLLGTALIYTLSVTEGYEIYTTYNTNPLYVEGASFIPLEITDRKQVFQILESVAPDVVIHTAALTDVDLCEMEKEKAWQVNVEGTRNVADASKGVGARLVYISTDYVFDGEKGSYSEEAKTNPVNYYGVTKLEGERVVDRHASDYLITRTTLYGWNVLGGHTLATWVIDKLQNGEGISGITDQLGSPILVNDFSDVLLSLIEKQINGTYHIASSEKITKFDFAVKVGEAFGLDVGLISPIRSKELERRADLVARRPKDVSLDVGKVSNELQIKLPDIHKGLERMKKLRKEGYLDFFQSPEGGV